MQKRTMFHIFVLIIGFPFLVAECPTNSQKWMDKCFYFISKPVSFNDANLECKNAYNGNLVSIHDGFTNSWINTQANNFFHNSSTSELWIGANGTSSSWTWTDGSASDFSDWGHQASYGNCGAMNSVNGLWNWENCSGARPFVCETDSTTTTTTTPSTQACPSDWFYFSETNSCYYWTEKFTWSEAENFCVSQSSHLASIHSFSELNFTQTIYHGNLWIGLYGTPDLTTWNTVWKWTDDSILDYSSWSSGMPKLNDGACVMATPFWTNFKNTNCTLPLYGICKKISSKSVPTITPSPSLNVNCSEGWTYYNFTNSCYLFKTVDATNFEDAEKYCVAKGAHLASIHDKNELSFVQSFANIYPWIGLYTNDTSVVWNSTWYWTDNTPVNFEKWAAHGIPNLDQEMCVYLTQDFAANDGFQNVNCSFMTPYAVCKTAAASIFTTTRSLYTTTPNKHCNSGWTYFERRQSCFLRSEFSSYNWTSAESFCAYNGGHLASFHSDDEYKSVGKVGDWIGLYTNDSTVHWNSTWFWTDNSQVDYLKWDHGIPSLDGNLCVYWSTYGFNNRDCSANNYTALCKMSSHDAVTTPTAISTPVSPVQPCLNDKWKYYGATNSCFLFTSPLNRTAAELFCAVYDSQLASFHEQEECDVFGSSGLCSGYECSHWIGLYSDDNAIMWKWTDGSPFDFPHWLPDYPVRGGSPYGIIDLRYSNGFSNKYTDDKILNGICKRKAYKK